VCGISRCYHSYKDRLPSSPAGGEGTQAYLQWIKSSYLTSSLTNVNVFLISEPQGKSLCLLLSVSRFLLICFIFLVGIMMRVDSTTFNSLTVKGKNKTTFDIDGAKLVSLTSWDEPFICVRSDDVKVSPSDIRNHKRRSVQLFFLIIYLFCVGNSDVFRYGTGIIDRSYRIKPM